MSTIYASVRTLAKSGMSVTDWDRDSGRVAFTWAADRSSPLADQYRLGRGSVSRFSPEVTTEAARRSLIGERWTLRVWTTAHLGIDPSGSKRTSQPITITSWSSMPTDEAILDTLDTWEAAGPPLPNSGGPDYYFTPAER